MSDEHRVAYLQGACDLAGTVFPFSEAIIVQLAKKHGIGGGPLAASSSRTCGGSMRHCHVPQACSQAKVAILGYHRFRLRSRATATFASGALSYLENGGSIRFMDAIASAPAAGEDRLGRHRSYGEEALFEPSAATERRWSSSDSSGRRDIKTRRINADSATDQSAGLTITMSYRALHGKDVSAAAKEKNCRDVPAVEMWLSTVSGSVDRGAPPSQAGARCSRVRSSAFGRRLGVAGLVLGHHHIRCRDRQVPNHT